jgi:hypothetical protein
MMFCLMFGAWQIVSSRKKTPKPTVMLNESEPNNRPQEQADRQRT